MTATAGVRPIRPTARTVGGVRGPRRGGALAAAGRAGALLVLAIGAPLRVLGVLATHGYLAEGTADAAAGADGAPAAGDDPPP